MNARKYLVSKGLAKQGRGRFSREAVAELNKAIASGVVFDDYDSNGVRKPVEQESSPRKVKIREFTNPILKAIPTKCTAPGITENKKVRTENVMYGVDYIAGKKSLVIAFDMCAVCTKSVSFCNCSKGPQLPKFMGGGPGMLSNPNDN